MIPRELIHEITDENEYAEFRIQSFGFGNDDIAPADKLIAANLSHLNIMRLKKKVADLRETGQLNQETFSLALQRVTLHNPRAPQDHLNKKIKHTAYNRSQHSLENGVTFFLNKGASSNRTMQGREGFVNRAYDSVTAPLPCFRVKRFKLNDQVPDPEGFARREAKFCQLLGNPASWYMSKKGPVVVANWIEGTSLDQLDTSNITYKRGYKLLASVAAAINHVHKHNRILGEIKAANLVVHEDTMSPIDYTAARKQGSLKVLPFTIAYIDPNEGEPRNFSSDMYALHFVMARIFRKLFVEKMQMTQQFFSDADNTRVSCQIMKPQIEICKATQTPTELAAIHLLEALRDPDAQNRCTSEQMMEYCLLIAEKIDEHDQLNEKDLQEILQKTLNSKTCTVEDALRGCRRPSKFAELHNADRATGSKSSQSGFTIFNPSANKKLKNDKDSDNCHQMDLSH